MDKANLDELDKLLDEVDLDNNPLDVDVDLPTISSDIGNLANVNLENDSPLPFVEWNNFALDLILYPERRKDVLTLYGMDENKLKILLSKIQFKNLYTTLETTLENITPEKMMEFKVKYNLEKGINRLGEIIDAGRSSDVMKAVEYLMKMSGLDKQGTSTGTTFNLNIHTDPREPVISISGDDNGLLSK